jgi:hypothetical protein
MQKTIVLDGVEYILTPKESVVESSKEGRLAIDDFEIPETPTTPPTSVVAEPTPEPEPLEPPPSNVMIVNHVDGVQEAIPKDYEYQGRFLRHEITTQDRIGPVKPTINPTSAFQELPEIKLFDAGREPPKGKFGFYGAGMEADYIG